MSNALPHRFTVLGRKGPSPNRPKSQTHRSKPLAEALSVERNDPLAPTQLENQQVQASNSDPMAIRAHEHVNLDAKRKAMNTLAATLAL